MIVSGFLSAAVLYSLLVVVASLACGLLAVYAWQRRDIRGARSLTATMAGGAAWNGCTALQLLVDNWDVISTVQAIKLGSIGVAVGGLFALALEFSGNEELVDRRLGALLAIEPVTIATLAATNQWHGFVRRSLEATDTAFNTVTGQPLIGFWLHTGYSYALVTVALGLLIVEVVRSRSIYRKQVAIVLAGALLPAIMNLLSFTGLLAIDLQPFAFVVTGLLVVWGIRRYRLIDLVPTARDHVVDTLPHPVIVLDESDRITDVNDAGRSLFGSSTVLGTQFQEAFQKQPAFLEQIDGAVQTTVPIELTVGTNVRHYEVHCSAVSAGGHDATGRVLLFHDVTERVRNRQELERQNEQLERFASVVSHDLRNPLSVAEGYLDLARETGDDEHFEAVEESHDRMGAIIQDVLTLARNGSQIEDRQPVSLERIAHTAWEQVATGDADLVVEDVSIAADPDRLQRLLENCFRNSIEHGSTAGEDGDPLTISVAPIAPADSDGPHNPDSFGFYVEDDGVGIPSTDQEGIFEPGNSSSAEGTGLGLSIVQGIAEAHGWSVRATDADSGGARFEFTGAPPVDAATVPAGQGNGAQR